MVLILRSTGPYFLMAKSVPHLRSVSDCARFWIPTLRGFTFEAAVSGPKQNEAWHVARGTSHVWQAGKLLPDTRECPTHVFLFQW